MTAVHQPSTGLQCTAPSDLDVWIRRVGALVVAGVAAYASYQHQRTFALRGGADAASAGLWPLSVDGLLLLATAGLLKSDGHPNRRVRLAGWLAFTLGIGVSLAANIAAAPALAWQPVLVAGWPPVALLLAVELLSQRPHHREHIETATTETQDSETETNGSLTPTRPTSAPARPPTAEDVMWDHCQQQMSHGRIPTGAELDRIAGTNNFGRAVLRRWRQTGRIPSTSVLRLGSSSSEATASDTCDEKMSSSTLPP